MNCFPGTQRIEQIDAGWTRGAILGRSGSKDHVWPQNLTSYRGAVREFQRRIADHVIATGQAVKINQTFNYGAGPGVPTGAPDRLTLPIMCLAKMGTYCFRTASEIHNMGTPIGRLQPCGRRLLLAHGGKFRQCKNFDSYLRVKRRGERVIFMTRSGRKRNPCRSA